MKRQNKQRIKAHLLRGGFYLLVGLAGTLVFFFRLEARVNISHRTLTFAERVGYQRTIEEVYWRHRIWPKENPNPKPSLDAVMSQAQLEKKVEEYLRNSQLLARQSQRPITPDQLQAEINRMASHTRQPDVLRELLAALGNDPFIVAECLARPILSERLVNELHTASNPPRGIESHELLTAETGYSVSTDDPDCRYYLPEITSPPVEDPAGGCIDDTWSATSTTGAPAARTEHAAVWTGTEMIVWGGESDFGSLNTGGRYNPSTDTWVALPTSGAPDPRWEHTAVWTGTEMIVWGGASACCFTFVNTGGRYNPSTDSWVATTITGAPDPRWEHTAVWTGTEMIVWGGANQNGYVYLNTGGRYNPSTDSWVVTTTIGAPDPRAFQTAVWTGTEMIVWAGYGGNYFNTGGKYNPSTDTWISTTTTGAPGTRAVHTAVWTGTEMIVWGGQTDINPVSLNTGGKYDPITDTWVATTTTGAPTGRAFHSAVWTGTQMIIWGGINLRDVSTGARYNPSANTWVVITNTDPPDRRRRHTAVWTGTEMIVWGGINDRDGFLNTGGRYCVQAGAPSPTPTPTGTATARPTSTPIGTPRVIPTPRIRPTAAPRP